MTPTTLTWTHLALLTGAALLSLALLYLLRPKPQRVEVPFLHLWLEAAGQHQAMALLGRLRRLLSFLIMALLVCLLTLALADPRAQEGHLRPRSLLLLIDASASMGAHQGAPLGRARDTVARLIRAMGPQDQALLASFGRTVRVHEPLTPDRSRLLAALEQIRPLSEAGDTEGALAWARDLAPLMENAILTIVTDQPLDNPQGQTLLVGEGADNLSISAFGCRPMANDPFALATLIEITSFAASPAQAQVTLWAGQRPVATRAIAVPPGQRAHLLLEGLPASGEALEARLHRPDGVDALEADNHAFAILPRARPLRVLLVSEGNLYLEAGLLTLHHQGLIILEQATPPEARLETGWDLVILDRWLPDTRPPGNLLLLRPAGGYNPFPSTPSPATHITWTDKRHPLLAKVVLDDVNISSALKLKAAKGDKVLASYKSHPLLLERRDAQGLTWALAFDLNDSDLPLRTAFPLLLANLVASLPEGAGSPGPPPPPVRPGDTVTVEVSPLATSAQVKTPWGETLEARPHKGRLTLFVPRAGIYEVTDDLSARALVAVNLDPREGDTLAARGEPQEAPAPQAPRPPLLPWQWLAALAICILAVEWWTYSHHMTV